MANKNQIDNKEVKQRWIAEDILREVRADNTIPEQINNDEARLDYLLRRLYGIE